MKDNKIIVDKEDLLYLMQMTYGYIDDDLGGMDKETDYSKRLNLIMEKYLIKKFDINNWT